MKWQSVANQTVILIAYNTWLLFLGKRSQNTRESSSDIFLSQDQFGTSSQIRSSQRSTRNSSLPKSQLMSSQDMEAQEKMQLISNVIRYVFVANTSKQPIQKTQIVKNVLNGNARLFRTILEKVNRELSEVYLFIYFTIIIRIYIFFSYSYTIIL